MDGTVREFNQAQQTILPLTPKWGESGRLVLGYPTDGTDGGSVAPQAEKKEVEYAYLFLHKHTS
jgi:hypothetical protein